jgi:mannose-6-phosphate isomerase-like protein (cupin superfamily)
MKSSSLMWMFLAAVPALAVSGERATMFSANQIKNELTQLAPKAVEKGSSGSVLASTGNLALKTSVRTTSGGAEIHAKYDDLMIVEQGSATLITGGTIANAKTNDDGETTGPSIDGGVSREIKPGDVIIVPAGVPHQLIVPPGVTYAALVAKVKEG